MKRTLEIILAAGLALAGAVGGCRKEESYRHQMMPATSDSQVVYSSRDPVRGNTALRLLDSKTGTEKLLLEGRGEYGSPCFGPDGKVYFIEHFALKRLSLDSRLVEEVEKGDVEVTFNELGERFVVKVQSPEFDAEKGSIYVSKDGKEEQILGTAGKNISASGNMLATELYNNGDFIALWNRENGIWTKKNTIEGYRCPTIIAEGKYKENIIAIKNNDYFMLSPDGRIIAQLTEDGNPKQKAAVDKAGRFYMPVKSKGNGTYESEVYKMESANLDDLVKKYSEKYKNEK